jgi:hypothetical protein
MTVSGDEEMEQEYHGGRKGNNKRIISDACRN